MDMLVAILISQGVVQVRIEEFGAAEYVSRFEEYLFGRDYFGVEVVPCADNRSSKLDRAYDRWEPPMREDKLRFPTRLLRPDSDDIKRDLVGLFLRGVLEKFPNVLDDNLLDAGGELWEDEKKKGPDGSPLYGQLQFPEALPAQDHEMPTGRQATTIMGQGLL